MIESLLRKGTQPYFDRFGHYLALCNFTPHLLTFIGFISGLLCALCISGHSSMIACAFLWFSGLCDVMDGTLARLTGKVAPFGAYVDLICDRMVESALMLGFAYAYPEHFWAYLIFLIALLFHFSTFVAAGALFKNSSTKSMHYDTSLIERAEAFIVFSAMIVFPNSIFHLLMTLNVAIIISGITRYFRVLDYSKASTM